MSESVPPYDADDSSQKLSPNERRVLLHIARSTLDASLRHQPLPVLRDEELSERLREKRAAFVTLRERGQLRGCVGYPAHRAPLVQTVQENVLNAALRDPRFPPVTIDELPSLAIEISVLSRGDSPDRPFIRLDDPTEIVLGRDGLLIEHRCGCSGLLLPQVPIEHHWDLADFLEGICHKAGLPGDAWRDPKATLYRFSAEVFAETHPMPA